MSKTTAEKLQTRKKEPAYVRALFVPDSVNKEARTVDVVFATDTPVRMYSWDGPFDEILSMDSASVRLDRLNAGAPLLNNHDRYSGVSAVFARVERAWIDGNKARATVRFSKRADVEPVWQDVQDGILTGISTGYRVYTYEITEREGEVDTYRAIDWEPFELSLAPIPADYGAAIRNDDSKTANEVQIRSAKASDNKTINHNQMTEQEKQDAELKRAAAENERKRAKEIRAAVRSAKLDESFADEHIEKGTTIDEVRKLILEKIGAPSQPETRSAATPTAETERHRIKEIRAAVRAAKLDEEFADELIDGEKTIDEARKLIIEKFAKADPGKGQRSDNGTATVTTDEADKVRAGMENAIIQRSAPDKLSTEEKKAIVGNEFRGMSLIRMAEDCLQRAGVKTRGMTNQEIASAALGLRSGLGLMSTGDFPIILGNTINRRLQAEYNLAPQTFRKWCSRGTATDFRQKTVANLSELGDFAIVPEGGEYQNVTVNEGSEVYKVAKYGQKIGITWETLINDDLSAFNRLPAKIAQAAARKQSDVVYAILTANANMGDGVALFHATHGNLMTAAAISQDSLSEGRKLARNMKGKAGKDFLNLMPSFLLVGSDKEKEALQFTSADYLPTTASQVNPWKSLEIIVEPRLTGNQWYLLVSPGVIDTIEYSFLDGSELYTETRNGFDVDGVEVKARMVFGAKALDWKGMYKNVGA